MIPTYELICLNKENQVVRQGTWQECRDALPYPRLYDAENDMYVYPNGLRFVLRTMMENENA